MEHLKVAVIGCGEWGYQHARVFNELPGVRLEAVVDINPEKTQRATSMFHCKGYGSIDQMLDDIEVKAIKICTPTITHYDLTLIALNARKHVLVRALQVR